MSRTSSGTASGQGTAKAAEKVKSEKRQVKLSREQRQHLEYRIAEVLRSLRRKADSRDQPVPIKVKQAQKVVDAWEKKQNILENKRYKEINEIGLAVKEALFFQTPEEALKAVITLEKKVGQK